VGDDPVGVAGWLDFTAAIHHRVFDLTPQLHAAARAATVASHSAAVAGVDGGAKKGSDSDDVAVVLSAGCGAWCPNTAPTWLHSHRMIHTAAGAQPLLRALVVIEDANGKELSVLVTETTTGKWSSRVGAVPPTLSSSWTGSTVDYTLGTGDSWVSPPQAVPNDTLALDVPQASPPLGLPPYTFDVNGLAAGSVVLIKESNAVVYTFPEMVVGVVSLAAGSWSVGANGGTIRVEYCEVLLDAASGTCLRQSGYEQNGTVDIFVLPPSNATEPSPSHHVSSPSGLNAHRAFSGANLTTRFSWRGFQYAVVTVTGDAKFRGAFHCMYAPRVCCASSDAMKYCSHSCCLLSCTHTLSSFSPTPNRSLSNMHTLQRHWETQLRTGQRLTSNLQRRLRSLGAPTTGVWAIACSPALDPPPPPPCAVDTLGHA
jgi:hypothetical protein